MVSARNGYSFSAQLANQYFCVGRLSQAEVLSATDKDFPCKFVDSIFCEMRHAYESRRVSFAWRVPGMATVFWLSLPIPGWMPLQV